MGNVNTCMSVLYYTCSLRDVDGKIEFFEAYGMETITGAVSKIGAGRIKKLFPHLSDKTIRQLQRREEVDVLLGALHPSWHPERVERARSGGDFWIYRGKFGSCVGGRCPGMVEGTKKSEKLFTVNQIYHVMSSPATSHRSLSHELEYCPSRVKDYISSQGAVSTKRKGWIPQPLDIPANSAVRHADNSSFLADEPMVVSMTDVTEVDVPGECEVSVGGVLAVDVVDLHEVPAVEVLEPSEDHISDAAVVVVDPLEAPVFDVQAVGVVELFKVPAVGVTEVAAVELEDVVTVAMGSDLNVSAAPWKPRDTWTPVLSEVANSIPAAVCAAVLTGPLYQEDLFFGAESLGTRVEPNCGGCKCSKCPVPGSKYMFEEQRQYNKINKNLFRVEGVNRWYTEYPWCCPRSTLPKNDKVALQNLASLERSLSRDPDLAADFNRQIEDMVERGAAVILSEEEILAWDGDYYILPMVGVKGKKKSLRVCFDASRRQGKNPSFNDCILKGPERFINNILSVIIGFRNGRVAAVADIAKFYNQVHLTEVDMHMQRFLWRNMKKDVPPTVYAVKVNNFGVKASGCIATCALHRSADLFTEKYPVESREMKEQTYVDDQLVAATDRESMVEKTRRLDEIAEHAGMPNKGWTFSGDPSSEVPIGGESEEKEDKVLGVLWLPSSDAFKFKVVLMLKKGSEEMIITTDIDFRAIIGSIKLTRRLLLANVARIFDPAGFLTPIILQSKLLMRESWCGSVTG